MRDLRGLIKKDIYDQGGWCLDEKRNLIHNLVKTTLSKNCIEIGVYKGSSLFSFAEVLEEIGGKIIGIDPWSFEMSKNEIPLFDKNQEDYFYNELLKGQETFEFIYKGVCEIIENNDLSKTVSLIRKPSQDVFNNFILLQKLGAKILTFIYQKKSNNNGQHKSTRIKILSIPIYKSKKPLSK